MIATKPRRAPNPIGVGGGKSSSRVISCQIDHAVCRSLSALLVGEVRSDVSISADWGCVVAKYLVLIYGDEQVWADASPEWHEENGRRHQAFHADADGAVVLGSDLAPSRTATSVRRGSSGRPMITDGPFVETKEGLGGFYVIEAADDADALRLACLLPEASAETSGVEIRRMGAG
jgi:hypothetical protein